MKEQQKRDSIHAFIRFRNHIYVRFVLNAVADIAIVESENKNATSPMARPFFHTRNLIYEMIDTINKTKKNKTEHTKTDEFECKIILILTILTR